jgi:hypothetical protein
MQMECLFMNNSMKAQCLEIRALSFMELFRVRINAENVFNRLC